MESVLTAKWTQQMGTRRLTQAGRADLLRLSIPTTDKLMKGEPVDRNVLKDAMRQIGVEWSEDLIVQENTSQIPTNGMEAPRRSVRIWRLAIPLAAFVAAIWAVLGLRQEPSKQWMADFDRLFVQSEREYNLAQYPQARLTANRALEMANKHRSPEKTANALFMAGKIESAVGSVERARELFHQALTVREAFKDDLARSPILERLGDVEMRLGNFPDAQRAFERAAEGFRREGHLMGVAEAERGLGSVAFHQGSYGLAVSHYESSLAVVPADQRADFEADIQGLRALVYSAQSKHDLARKELRASLLHWESKKHPRWIASTELKLARVEIQASNPKEAKHHLQRARSGYQAASDSSGLLTVAELEAQIGT